MPQWLVTLIISVLRVLLPALFDAAKPTAEDGQGPGELEKDLENQLRKEGWLG